MLGLQGRLQWKIARWCAVERPEKTQSRLDAFGTLLYTLVMGLVAWRVAVGGVDIKANQETSMLMALPLWIPYMLMVPGLVLCTVIGLVQTLQHLGLMTKETV
jgi:TRAP-type C4-dicarboxylate transport system permease small subunit